MPRMLRIHLCDYVAEIGEACCDGGNIRLGFPVSCQVGLHLKNKTI